MGLKDFFGRWFTPQVKPEIREIAAVSLQDRWSSYPSVGLTPGGLGAIFQEADQGSVRTQMELFEEMEEKDAHLASLLQTRKQSVLSLDYEVLPYADTPEDRQIAEAVGEVVFGIPDLENACLDLLDAIGKGFALTEIIWGVDRKLARVEELKWVPQKKITFVDDLNPRLVTADGPWQGVPFPPWKVIYHRYKAKSGYDSRAGMLRVVGYMYLLKNYSLKDWVAFNEVFGMPLRLGKYDPASTPADREALIQAVRNLGSRRGGDYQQEHGDRVRGDLQPVIRELKPLSGAGGFLQPGDVQGHPGADPDHGHFREHGHLRGGQGALPGAQRPDGGGRPVPGANPAGATAAPPGGLQFRLGQTGALVPLPVRGKR